MCTSMTLLDRAHLPHHPAEGHTRSIMSWQEYVDDHLMCDLPNGGNLKSAAIVGLDGGVWAQSPNFPTLSNDEVHSAYIRYLTM